LVIRRLFDVHFQFGDCVVSPGLSISFAIH
jgi:hypothetical protein